MFIDELLPNINRLFNNSIQMSIFSSIKTNNPIVDTMLSTIILTFLSYIVKLLFELEYIFKLKDISLSHFCKNMFYKENIIIM